jgi:hypothetical protein
MENSLEQSLLKVTELFLTLAGQTAPSPGIMKEVE